MSWNRRYWDIVDRYYWSPGELGIDSIPKDRVRREDGEIVVPASEVARGARLYTRRPGARSFVLSRLNGYEETLNDVFNLAFSIAPDAVVQELLLDCLCIEDDGPFELHAREIGERFGWGQDNVTQPDAFLTSPRSAVGVELKLGADSTPDQVLKYLALMVLEEELTGLRERVGLLFIAPPQDEAVFWSKTGLSGPRIDEGFLDRAIGKKQPNSRIVQLLTSRRESVEDVARRLVLARMTWGDLVARIDGFIARLDETEVGDQTLIKLLGGLRAQIAEHGGTGIREAG